MTTSPVPRPGATTLTSMVDGDLLWAFVLLIVSALFIAGGTPRFVRAQYRETRRQWPLAKLIWIMAGVGVEALAAGLIAVGISGLLGLDSSPAVFVLAIAEVCGAIGIPILFIAILIGIIVRIRYGWPHES